MEYSTKLHHAQANVLYLLRHATRARYGELRRPTGLESDIFKYHLQKLMRAKYVIKTEDGLYELTAEGKEFANRVDETTGREIEQPKSSMLLLVTSQKDGRTYYLAHRRTREPFRDYWGIGSAPVLRGVPICESAAREIKKQTGLHIAFEVKGMYRVIDRNTQQHILEDKLFALMYGEITGCPPLHHWYGGESVWLTREELLAKDKLFPTTAKTLAMIEQGQLFAEAVCVYDKTDY